MKTLLINTAAFIALVFAFESQALTHSNKVGLCQQKLTALTVLETSAVLNVNVIFAKMRHRKWIIEYCKTQLPKSVIDTNKAMFIADKQIIRTLFNLPLKGGI